MKLSDFKYPLPRNLVAKHPAKPRDSARLMVLNRALDTIEEKRFSDLIDYMKKGDCLVVNQTRVFPARLYGRRRGLRSQPVSVQNPAARDFLHGRIEVLLTRQLQREPNEWECLVRPGRKIGVGEQLYFGEHDELQAELIARIASLPLTLRQVVTLALEGLSNADTSQVLGITEGNVAVRLTRERSN